MQSIRLDGQVMIVTGGAGGIGEATASMAAERGARIVVADIAAARAEEVAHRLCDAGAEAIAVKVDLADEAEIATAVRQSVDHFGALHILNNNAALQDPTLAQRDTDVEHMTTDIWDLNFAINLRGAMLMARESLPHLVAHKGNIVNTVSNLGLQGHVVQNAYSTTKAGLIHLTRCIAASHGRQGVRCNAVAPGMTLTPSLIAAFPEPLRRWAEDETLREQLGEPGDIAEVICWVASDAARNVTGQVITADGGSASHVPGYMPFLRTLETLGS